MKKYKVKILVILLAAFIIADCGLLIYAKMKKGGEVREAFATATAPPEAATPAPTEEPPLSYTPAVRKTPVPQDGTDVPSGAAGTDMGIVTGKNKQVKICIDPGHGITGRKDKEPVAPGSSEKKAANVGGASGKHITEEEFNLSVSLKLAKLLKKQGYTVDMTRTEHKSDKSNIDRAEQGNQADFVIRIHADGSDNSTVGGVSMLVPAKSHYGDTAMVTQSRKLGQAVLSQVAERTGAKNRGIVERSDLTGFNWSKVPAVLLECGFLSNAEEEALLSQDAYQQKIAEGISLGIRDYLAAK